MKLKFKVELPDDLSDRETQALRKAVFDAFSPNSLAAWIKENWGQDSCNHLVASLHVD